VSERTSEERKRGKEERKEEVFLFLLSSSPPFFLSSHAFTVAMLPALGPPTPYFLQSFSVVGA
jgi:hypothetical protein